MRLKPAFAILALALAASAAGASAAETITVTVKGFTFAPATVNARVGDTIVWNNQDVVVHTATGKNKEWDVSIAAGKSASLVIEKAGAVDYFCRFHPNMTGKIDVAGN